MSSKLCFLALALAGLVTPAAAAEAYVGKWAADARACKSEPLFTLGAKSFAGLTMSCEKAAYAKDGKGWKAELQQCTTEEEGAAPLNMSIRMTVEAGKLQIFWDDGSKTALLLRCK